MTRQKRKPLRLLWLAALLLLFFYAFSEDLRIVTYTLETDKVTSPVRLAVLTDLHSCYYGEKQEELIEAIHTVKPDAVCLVGDILDDETPHIGTLDLLGGITGEYPCYYVTGNHEHWSEEVTEIKAMLELYGVTVLAGDTEILTANGQSVSISGIDDPTGFYRDGSQGTPEPDTWLGQLAMAENAAAESPYFTVLLSHRPEKTEEYTASPFDLVLSGHAHGGQIRIPLLLNGLFAPNQGYFPKYAGGRYDLDGTVMIVSRGLCRNDLPRVFNRPELVVADIVPAGE